MATSSLTWTSGSDNVARLCSACQLLAFRDDLGAFEEASDDDGSYLLPKLSESFRQGCDFCGFLRGAILSGAAEGVLLNILGGKLEDADACEVSITADYLWQRKQFGRSGVFGLVVTVDFNDTIYNTDDPLRINCLAQAVQGSESVSTWLGLRLPQNYSDEKCIRWMKQMITDCEEHKHELAGEPFIPERLIDVRGEDPKLVLRSDLGSDGHDRVPEYAALSYCWGSSVDAETQLKTTTISLAERQVAIRDIEMTQVLRDAVHVTRALSIPYLWVDALCILQDNISDWERHITTRIYRLLQS
ncbi:hypothetical protein DL765_006461 [Monosporascus sp. GIB2]|nr:hypothetical protein DL765_006461 [Monosporascus sp. GIB2]